MCSSVLLKYKKGLRKPSDTDIRRGTESTPLQFKFHEVPCKGMVLYRSLDDFNFAFQEITVQQLMAHLDSIRKDMVILEKSEFANLRAENQVIQVSIY